MLTRLLEKLWIDLHDILGNIGLVGYEK